MGLFGGKKKKAQPHKEDSGARETRRRSSRTRRVVGPDKGDKSADPGTGSKAKRSASGKGSSASRPARPNTSRLPAKKPDGATHQEKRGRSRSQTGEGSRSAPPPRPEPKELQTPVAASEAPPDSDVLDLDFDTLSEGSGAGNGAASADRSGNVSRSGDQPLIDFLVNKANLIDASQASAAQAQAQDQDRPLDVLCYELGYFNQEQLVKALTEECWVPHLKVEKYAIRKKALDAIDSADAQYFGVLPVDKLGSILNLAMVNPLDMEAVRLLQQKTSLEIKRVVATRDEIEAGINRYYGGDAAADDGALCIEQDAPSRRVTAMMQQVDDAVTAPAVGSTDEPPFDRELERRPTVALDEELDADLSDEPLPAAGSLSGVEDTGLFSSSTSSLTKEGASSPPPIVEDPPSGELSTGKDVNLAGRSGGYEVFDLDELLDDGDSAPSVIEPVSIVVEDQEDVFGNESDLVEAVVSTSIQKPKRETVDLIAVSEEQFQSAISKGRGRIFEKWMAVQTRNRILNAVAVENDLVPLLEPLEAEPGLKVSA